MISFFDISGSDSNENFLKKLAINNSILQIKNPIFLGQFGWLKKNLKYKQKIVTSIDKKLLFFTVFSFYLLMLITKGEIRATKFY